MEIRTPEHSEVPRYIRMCCTFLTETHLKVVRTNRCVVGLRLITSCTWVMFSSALACLFVLFVCLFASRITQKQLNRFSQNSIERWYMSYTEEMVSFCHLSVYLSIYLSIYPSTQQSIHPSIHLSIYLSIYQLYSVLSR